MSTDSMQDADRDTQEVSARLSMRRDFADRTELIDYLTLEFPRAAVIDDHVSQTPGGRIAADRQLANIEPSKYAKTRNNLLGSVTRLSPYIRHGVISLAEVRDATLATLSNPKSAYKFVQELAWRDYYQRVYAQIGDGIWRDRESYKTGLSANDYSNELPEDLRTASTGLACMDGFSRELSETGYLHNHARMWLASYVVHWRRVRWQVGAKWFLQHLLDGDPASNNLSWQWVGSTFSIKPYIFNRENLERGTNGIYCNSCPLYGRCVFEGSYDHISARLFSHASAATQQPTWDQT